MASTIKDIISAMELAAQQGLRHFSQSDGITVLSLWRGEGATTSPLLVAAPGPTPTEPAKGPDAEAGMITAPLAGICHLSPDPDSLPFVAVGARVAQGQTMCIIEAMKMMTAVHAPQGGVVARVHVASGATVAAGDLILEIRP